VRAARQRVAAAAALLLLVLAPVAAWGQVLTPQPPGGLTFDIRGTTLGVPQTSDFFPDLPGDTIVPARGFGLEAGAHVYPWARGSRAIGVGVNLLWTRASATATPVPSSSTAETTSVMLPEVTVSMRVLSPQLSLNFGTSRGWSYLTVGGGGAWIRSTAEASERSRSVGDVNAGGGARWFISEHVGVGFDLGLHWLGGSSLFAASAGFSLK
jgi:hypothetical protein